VWLQKWIYKDIYLKEIGRHAQNMINILNSIVRKGGGGGLGGGACQYVQLMNARIFNFILLKKIFIRTPNFAKEVATTLIWT
jgi:hypothetical protein